VWLVLFLGSLQMVSELLSKVRSCGIGTPHDVALMSSLGV